MASNLKAMASTLIAGSRFSLRKHVDIIERPDRSFLIPIRTENPSGCSANMSVKNELPNVDILPLGKKLLEDIYQTRTTSFIEFAPSVRCCESA